MEWYTILNSGEKYSKGNELHKVILKIMKSFLQYDLDSEVGLGKVAEEMKMVLEELNTVGAEPPSSNTLNRAYLVSKNSESWQVVYTDTYFV
jgi:hypothetical protein